MSPNYNSKQSSKAQILPLTQLKWVTCIKIHLRGCHEVQKFARDQNKFLWHAVNMFTSALKMGNLTWRSMESE